MKRICLLLLVFFLFSCTTKKNDSAKTQEDSIHAYLIPETTIALTFLNDYAEFCMQRTTDDKEWIQTNPLVSEYFKKAYTNLLDSAFKADPEMGLGFDPIFDAQDYPDQGFELVSYDNVSGFVTVTGIDWPDFFLVLKLIHHDNKWLVDGAGVINIPANKRAIR